MGSYYCMIYFRLGIPRKGVRSINTRRADYRGVLNMGVQTYITFLLGHNRRKIVGGDRKGVTTIGRPTKVVRKHRIGQGLGEHEEAENE